MLAHIAPYALLALVVVLALMLVGSRLALANARLWNRRLGDLAASLLRSKDRDRDRDLPPASGSLADLHPCDRPLYAGEQFRDPYYGGAGIRCTLPQGHAQACASVHGHRGAEPVIRSRAQTPA